MVLCPDAALRYDRVPPDRVHRDLPSLRDQASLECLRTDPPGSGGILQGLWRRDVLYTAQNHRSPADPRNRIRVDSDGDHVRSGAERFGGSLATGKRSAGCSDPPIR